MATIAVLQGARGPPRGDLFLWAVVGLLLVFAGASVGAGILYQRDFWILLGLALAVPQRPSRDHDAVDAAGPLKP